MTNSPKPAQPPAGKAPKKGWEFERTQRTIWRIAGSISILIGMVVLPMGKSRFGAEFYTDNIGALYDIQSAICFLGGVICFATASLMRVITQQS